MTDCLSTVIQLAIDELNHQQSSHGKALSFSNYPAVKRACRQNNCLLHLSSKIQRSQVSAFHVSYRISLRSSSIHDPSDPPFRVILVYCFHRTWVIYSKQLMGLWRKRRISSARAEAKAKRSQYRPAAYNWTAPASLVRGRKQHQANKGRAAIKNDPSAGSPTETLLRLLVPPVDQVYQTLPRKVPGYPESYRNSMWFTKPTSRY